MTRAREIFTFVNSANRRRKFTALFVLRAGKSQESQMCVAFTRNFLFFSRLIAGQDNWGKINLERRLEENAISSRTGSALASTGFAVPLIDALNCDELQFITAWCLCLFFYVSHKPGCTCAKFCGTRTQLCKFMVLEKPLGGKTTYVKHLSRSAGNPQFSFHRSQIRCKFAIRLQRAVQPAVKSLCNKFSNRLFMHFVHREYPSW